MAPEHLVVGGSRAVTVRVDGTIVLSGIVLPAALSRPLPPNARPLTFREEGADAVVTVGLSMGGGAAQAAGPTATAWVVPGFGHAESGATAPLVERIGRWASATING